MQMEARIDLQIQLINVCEAGDILCTVAGCNVTNVQVWRRAAKVDYHRCFWPF